MRKLLTAALVVAAVQTGLGRESSAIVRLDAVVVDSSGRAVNDLGADEFEVIEQGVPRPIESVRFVSVNGGVAGATAPSRIESSDDEQVAASRQGARLFALFLDEYHVSAGSSVEGARAALLDFVDKRLGPEDLVLVVKPLDSLPNMRLMQDRAAIRAAISSFEGRKGDYAPRTPFEKDFIAADPARIDAVRAQISASVLNAVAVHLGSLQSGRKTIVAVSEGFARPVHRRGDPALPSIDTVIRTANRSGASIYAFDPRIFALSDPVASPSSPEEAAVSTLRTLSTETGGQAILSDQEKGRGFDRMLGDASGYYLVAFEPASNEETGRFHAVAVRVVRPGVTLRTRPGYWEALPDPAIAIAAITSAVPLLLSHASPFIRSWFGFSRGNDGKTRVQYVWGPAVRVPGDRLRSREATRTILNAIGPDGNILFSTEVGADGQAQAVFDVDPGPVHVQIEIEDQAANVIDTDVRQLMVARLDGPLALGTSQVLRARSAREFRQLAGDPAAVPVVDRQFSRTDRLLIRVPVYASGDAPVVTAALSSALGQVMRDIPVSAGDSDSNIRTIDLPLAGLASGEYHLDVLARSGDVSVKDSLTFRVTP
jgi:VWFA-related protein